MLQDDGDEGLTVTGWRANDVTYPEQKAVIQKLAVGLKHPTSKPSGWWLKGGI